MAGPYEGFTWPGLMRVLHGRALSGFLQGQALYKAWPYHNPSRGTYIYLYHAYQVLKIGLYDRPDRSL